jgi:hypothetical protein
VINVNILCLLQGWLRCAKGTRTTFALEIENDSMTQPRHLKSDAAIIMRHGTNKYVIMSGFNPDVPLEVNDHQVVEALVAEARKWITQRNKSRVHEASEQAEQGEPARFIEPSCPGRVKGPIVSGPLRPIFLFDLEVERGPGYVRFDRALLQWNSVVIGAGHFRIDFPRRFESELTDLVAGGANSEQSCPFITYDCDLAGFSTFCEAPGVISYFAFGR